MTPFDLLWLLPVSHLLVAAAFLLLGWRLGRESVGRPMFEFAGSAREPEAVFTEEADPWAAAMAGLGPANAPPDGEQGNSPQPDIL